MRTERLEKTLSAYVDGELSPRERRAVQRLLRESPEAQSLLQNLQHDAELVRGLPRAEVDEGFSSRVVAALPADVPMANPVVEPRYSLYGGLAAAAVILVAVGVSSYLFFSGAWTGNNDDQYVTQPTEPEREIVPVPIPKTTPKKPTQPTPTVPAPTQIVKELPPTTTIKPPPTTPVKPPPTQKELAGPVPSMEGFQVVNPRFAVVMDLREMQKSMERDNLRTEMSKDPASRLELFGTGKEHAFDRLQAALKGQGAQLRIDDVAQARLKNKKLKTDLVLYCDDLTVADWIAILQRLANQDVQAEAKKPGDAQFGKLIALPLNDNDLREMAKLMGTDPKKIEKPRAGQGGAKVAASQLTKQALVLSYNPVRPKPQASKEIKAFLDARKQRRPGAIQVVLVLRGING